MKMLRSKLYALKLEEQNSAISANRKSQLGTGSRSEKIRTYNWKDNRCTDHRLNLNTPLGAVLDGHLSSLIESCILKDQEEQLKEMMEGSSK